MIKLYYCDIPNFGDQINPLLIERITGQKCFFHSRNQAELCGIGSLLTQFTRPGLFNYTRALFAPPIHVWSTGFIKEVNYHESFKKRQINFLALRGKLSLNRVEKIINQKISPVLGDGGLLMDLLLDKKPVPKYALALIPHTNDFNNPIFKQLADMHPHTQIIDLRQPPLDVLNQIAQSEFVLSTAMHGLVAADSLGIPNKWLEVSNNVAGNGYKFKDYYSVFDIQNLEPLRLKHAMHLDINALANEYKIKSQRVEYIKKQLYNCLKNQY